MERLADVPNTMNARVHAAPWRTPLLSALLAAGVLGWVQFVVIFFVEGVIRESYNWVRDAVSLLSLTSAGIVDIVSLVLLGVLQIGMAVAVQAAWAPARRWSWGPLLLALAGVGFICAGVFVTDPAQGYPPGTPKGAAVSATLHGTLHFALGASFVFGGLAGAAFVFARRYWVDGLRVRSLCSVIAGLAVIGGLAGFAFATVHDGPAGIFERVSFIAGLAWIVMLARDSRERTRRAARP